MSLQQVSFLHRAGRLLPQEPLDAERAAVCTLLETLKTQLPFGRFCMISYSNNVLCDQGFVRSEPINQFLHIADQEEALTDIFLGVISNLRAFKVNFSL